MINFTQFVVRFDKQSICWLNENGFKNCLPNSYGFPVFIVDLPSKSFFGTNTTCLSAANMQPNKPIILTFTQLKEKI